MESVNGRRPHRNEGPTGDDCAHDAPEEHLVLHVQTNLEIRQHEQEHEDVVGGQRQLQQPALKKFQPFVDAKTMGNEKVEGQAQATPDRDPYGGVACAHGVCLTIEHTQVDGQGGDRHQDEQAPNQG